MRVFIIRENEAGQRLDKFLHKCLPEASSGFLFKMLRKKNITLNGRKALGNEKLSLEDEVKLYLSDETYAKFSVTPVRNEYERAFSILPQIPVIYEDHDVLILNKPAGVLSQKASASDLSANEWMIGYLLAEGAFEASGLATFKPSVCNRLDRNTTGLLLCGKTLPGAQQLNGLLKDRTVRKYYRLFVKGRLTESRTLKGFLYKDASANRVTVAAVPSGTRTAPIETYYQPLQVYSDRTLLEVRLITGKTHQIRAHLSSIEHPLIGDYKYGDPAFNERYRAKFGVEAQLLHAYRLEFPELEGALRPLGGKSIIAPEPDIFKIMGEE